MKSAVLALLLLVAAAAPALALAGTCDFTQRSSIGTPYVNETRVTDASRLPVSRPPLWNFRTLENATWACTKTGLNGWTLTITHKPIPGVSKAAFKWMWDNMAGNAVGPDGNTYPTILLFHPRDHAFFDSTAKPLKAGASTTWVEFPLTGCSGTGAGAPWTCPTGGASNPGFLQSTPQSEWQCVEQLNTTTTKVISLTPASIKFGTQGCIPIGCAWIITTQHRWVYNVPKKELRVKTRLRIGYGNPTNDLKIVNGWRNGVDALEKCERQALHFVEEIGATEHWLQAAYTAANPAAGR